MKQSFSTSSLLTPLSSTVRALFICATLMIHLSSFAASHSSGVKKLSNAEIQSLTTLEIDDADAGSWEAGSRATLKTALNRQLARCKGQSGKTIQFDTRTITATEWCEKPVHWFLKQLETVNSLQELYARAAKDLEWYQSIGSAADAANGNGDDPTTGNGNVLFTGYYTPDIRVKLKRDSVYKYPIYKLPTNPKLYTRAEIEAAAAKNKGALTGQNLELGYAASFLDPYFLHVQGSGVLSVLADNGSVSKIIKIKNTGQNGRAYTSLRKLMLAAGIEERYATSMQGIRQYFTEYPDQWLKFSNQNESYVFFAPTQDDPQGAGATVTAKHSIAVDANYFPMGAIGLVHTVRPASISSAFGNSGTATATSWKPFAQFMLAQDIGGAIKSPGHADLYYGVGDYAKVAAGQTKHRGRLYFFLLKPVVKK